MVGMILLSSPKANAQEEESSSPFSVGADVVTNYIWRGVKFAGPSIQPYVELGLGGFTVGSWGSFAFDLDDAPVENDFYLSYSIGGFSIGLTDYYYQGPLFEFSDEAGSHAFELNAGFSASGFSISGNYILNEAGGAGSDGGDLYFELGYSFTNVGLFVGAGNGWHTIEEYDDETGTFEDDVFGVVNVGISTSKEITIGDFALPVSGSVIVNPQAEQAFVVVGFSL